MTPLDGWADFYVIAGPAAGALIGLQFVIRSLIADSPAIRQAQAGASFAAPTVVYSCKGFDI